MQPGLSDRETRVWSRRAENQSLSFSFVDILNANANNVQAVSDFGWALITLAPQLLSEEETQSLGEVMKALRDVADDVLPEKGSLCWISLRYSDEWMMEQRPSLLRKDWNTPIPNFFTYMLTICPPTTPDEVLVFFALARMLVDAESPEHLRSMAAAYIRQQQLNKLSIGHTPIKLSDFLEAVHTETAIRLLTYKRWLPDGFEGLDNSLGAWLTLKEGVFAIVSQDATITIGDLLDAVQEALPNANADSVMLDFAFDLMQTAETIKHYNEEAPHMTRMLVHHISKHCFREENRSGEFAGMFPLPVDASDCEDLQNDWLLDLWRAYDWLLDLWRAYDYVSLKKADTAMKLVGAWLESSNMASLQKRLDEITAEVGDDN